MLGHSSLGHLSFTSKSLGSVYNKQYNPAVVLLQYIGYLRRNPNDPPDNNFAGFYFWLNKLNSFSLPGEDMRDPIAAQSRACCAPK
jgi:hypothetical protein